MNELNEALKKLAANFIGLVADIPGMLRSTRTWMFIATMAAVYLTVVKSGLTGTEAILTAFIEVILGGTGMTVKTIRSGAPAAKAKKELADSNILRAVQPIQPGQPSQPDVLEEELESDATAIRSPLDINKLLEIAEQTRQAKYGYQTASMEETGLYFAFRGIGSRTRTTSLDHVLQYYDKLLELAHKSWYAETEKVLGKGKGFTWEERDSKLDAGDRFCPALTAYSWARRYSLDGLYKLIERDVVSLSWIEALASNFPQTDIVGKLQANCTLFRVGILAQRLYTAQEALTTK